MQVTINRNVCAHHPAVCEQCFGDFLREGLVAGRGCITEIVDDGRPEITARIRSGKHFGTLVVTEENREEVIYHGWMQFVQMPPEAFECRPPGSDDKPIIA